MSIRFQNYCATASIRHIQWVYVFEMIPQIYVDIFQLFGLILYCTKLILQIYISANAYYDA